MSRIYGDAKFCVELLTSKDKKRCQELAIETELANTRRKGLQKEVSHDVMKKLKKLTYLQLKLLCYLIRNGKEEFWV